QHFGADMAALHLRVVGAEKGRADEQEDVDFEIPGVRLMQVITPDHLVGDDGAGGEDQQPGEMAGESVQRLHRPAEAAPGWDRHHAPGQALRQAALAMAQRPGVAHLTASAIFKSLAPSLTSLAKSL